MAFVVDCVGEVREFLEENGMDIAEMSDEELEEASEVFPVSDGRYLVVEGKERAKEKATVLFVVSAFFSALSMA